MARLSKEQWDAIRAEWVAGVLSYGEIAKLFNVSKTAIINRKKKDEEAGNPWPPRVQTTAIVTAELTDDSISYRPVTTASLAHLVAFDRLLQLLLRHRRLARDAVELADKLNPLVKARLEELADPAKRTPGAWSTRGLKEAAMMVAAAAKATQTVMMIERTAFGLAEGVPSEADAMTDDHIQEIRQIIASRIQKAEEE